MKIAIPSETDEGLSSVRSGHFGHCAYFTLVDIEDGEIKNVEAVKNVDHDEFGCGGVIEYALGLGIEAILVAGMGVPPFTRFTQGGVAVYIDQEVPYVQDVVDKFIKGDIPRMQPGQACRH